MYDINFEIPAFLLSLLCFIYCLTIKHRQFIPPKSIKAKLSSQHFVFLIMLVANMLSSVSSVVGVYLTYASFEGVAFVQYLFHALYFIFHSTLSASFTLYIINVTATSLNWKKPSYVLFALPYIISEFLILTNRLTKWVFYMDENLIYHRGPLMLVLYAFGAIYVILGFVFFFKNKKAIPNNDSIAVGISIGIATIGIIIQALFSNLLVELFAEALACLVLLIVLEEKGGHLDPTTGLLNRIAFVEANQKLMGSKQRYYIVFIRLHEIEKYIQKFNGRETDELLMQVASYIVKESGSIDVFRYRREDFAVIFKETKYNAALKFIDNVIDRFNDEWLIDSIHIKAEAITFLISVPNDVRSFNDLDNLVSSDYHKTKSGSYFVPIKELQEITKSGMYESALRDALRENKLMLKYQPIWSVKEGRTVSAEALLRINSNDLKNVSPEIYIPIAEKTGLIRDIGLFVFEEVCKFLKNERLKGTSIKYVELNLSVYQFMYGNLVEEFENIRKRYGVDSSMINLEITESEATKADSDVSDTLARFRELGYTLSLDDFGTGYSNIARIVSSKYQNIKIDKSILWDLTSNKTDHELLKYLMKFINNLGSYIIQEGVETKEQLDLVIDCGCDYVQGYYFSRPVTEEEFFNYLESENK